MGRLISMKQTGKREIGLIIMKIIITVIEMIIMIADIRLVSIMIIMMIRKSVITRIETTKMRIGMIATMIEVRMINIEINQMKII